MTDHATRARELVKEWYQEHIQTAIISAPDHIDLEKAIAAALDQAAQEAVKDMEQRKNAAYLERNQVVAALAKCFPSGKARTAIEGWSEDWHNCVYIDLPTGQVSWHYHDSHAYLFVGVPHYLSAWDGHSTEEKYRRLAALQAAQPVWVNKAPGVTGWFFHRETSESPYRPIEIVMANYTGALQPWVIDGSERRPLACVVLEGGEWAGPIQLPREA